MKLMYCTSICYPSRFANRIQTLSMSQEFSNILGDNFWLGGKDIKKQENIYRGQLINFGISKSFLLSFKQLLFIKKNNIEVVFCREHRLLFFIMLYNWLFFHLKLKYIYEGHGIIKNKFFLLLFLHNLDKVVAINNFIAQKFINFGYSKNKILIAPNGVDLNIFNLNISKLEAIDRLDFSADIKNKLKNNFVLVYTGRFKTMGIEKGLINIFKALKKIKNIYFLAVGGTDEELRYYQGKADELAINDRIILLPYTSQQCLAIYQKIADALLMPFPKIEHYEFFMSPIKLFEYMASKRPIIASDLPSIREILNENNAVLVEPDNAEKLAEGIKKVLQNNDLADRISKQAYQDVQNYTRQKRAENIISFIRI